MRHCIHTLLTKICSQNKIKNEQLKQLGYLIIRVKIAFQRIDQIDKIATSTEVII
jgi:hypothetical protein